MLCGVGKKLINMCKNREILVTSLNQHTHNVHHHMRKNNNEKHSSTIELTAEI